MRALVTGAAGFLGGHVATALAGGGARVTAFDRNPPTGLIPDSVEVVLGDVLDPDAVRRAVEACDAVFHLAAVYSYARGDATLMEAVNVHGTRTVLAAALSGKRRRIVLNVVAVQDVAAGVAVQDVAAGHVRAFEHGRPGERYLLGGETLLGYVSRPAASALGEAARCALAERADR